MDNFSRGQQDTNKPELKLHSQTSDSSGQKRSHSLPPRFTISETKMRDTTMEGTRDKSSKHGQTREGRQGSNQEHETMRDVSQKTVNENLRKIKLFKDLEHQKGLKLQELKDLNERLAKQSQAILEQSKALKDNHKKDNTKLENLYFEGRRQISVKYSTQLEKIAEQIEAWKKQHGRTDLQSLKRELKTLEIRYTQDLMASRRKVYQEYETTKEAIYQSWDPLTSENDPCEALEQWYEQELQRSQEILDQKYSLERKKLNDTEKEFYKLNRTSKSLQEQKDKELQELEDKNKKQKESLKQNTETSIADNDRKIEILKKEHEQNKQKLKDLISAYETIINEAKKDSEKPVIARERAQSLPPESRGNTYDTTDEKYAINQEHDEESLEKSAFLKATDHHLQILDILKKKKAKETEFALQAIGTQKQALEEQYRQDKQDLITRHKEPKSELETKYELKNKEIEESQAELQEEITTKAQELQKQVENLKEQRDQDKKKLEQLNGKLEENYDQRKKSLDEAQDTLRDAYDPYRELENWYNQRKEALKKADNESREKRNEGIKRVNEPAEKLKKRFEAELEIINKAKKDLASWHEQEHQKLTAQYEKSKTELQQKLDEAVKMLDDQKQYLRNKYREYSQATKKVKTSYEELTSTTRIDTQPGIESQN